jgi:hypothetical protein
VDANAVDADAEVDVIVGPSDAKSDLRNKHNRRRMENACRSMIVDQAATRCLVGIVLRYCPGLQRASQWSLSYTVRVCDRRGLQGSEACLAGRVAFVVKRVWVVVARVGVNRYKVNLEG